MSDSELVPANRKAGGSDSMDIKTNGQHDESNDRHTFLEII